ncbi:hypothetical protein MMC26_002180 [Xylographa opegraphella]|nr:hypothetical protein [Xylographa opegraphella]
MSMPAWLNDVPAVSNHDHGSFNSSVDPSMGFLQSPTSTNFDFNHMQNPQLQQRLQNGAVRNGSPAFQPPLYHTQSVVPSKRTRGGSDVYGASPRQAPGALPSSRSQTPQQAPYGGYPGNVNGSHQMPTPTPYQHLQRAGSSNASPSPHMQDQHFNGQAMPQRMQTVSPSPFSPGAPNYVSQASPHSDYGSRIDAPQSGGHPYMPGMHYGQGQAQPYIPPAGASSMGGQGGTSSSYLNNVPNVQQQQRMYDIRQHQLARQIQANNEAAQQRHHVGGNNPSSAQMANYQQARMQQAYQQQALFRPPNPDQWLHNVTRWMQSNGLPFNASPVFGGRPLHPVQLWSMIMKYGGSKKVTDNGHWQTVAASLGAPPVQYPTGAQEIQSYWRINLYPWEQAVLLNLQQQQTPLRHRPAHNPMTGMSQPPQGDHSAPPPDQFSPVKQLHSQNHMPPSMSHTRRPSAGDFQTSVKPGMVPQHDIRQAHLNGYATPQAVHVPNQSQSTYGVPQPGGATELQMTTSRARLTSFSTPTPMTMKTEPHLGSKHQKEERIGEEKPWNDELVPYADNKMDAPNIDPEKSTYFYGGIQLSWVNNTIIPLLADKPNVPKVYELGNVDIRALTMSLRSGIHAEVRVSLDTLATISSTSTVEDERHIPLLSQCEDLVETLVDCAEEQVEFLAESAAEVSDVMLINPYEEVVRGCHLEGKSLLDIPAFGTLNYDLDRAVDKLICITTILRNLTDKPRNHEILAESHVIKFMTTVIRYLGTRNMFLRTHRNTLDFSKDVVIYLKNLADSIKLPGKEEALCILHFLLSFAPLPSPTACGSGAVMFSSYDPAMHQYLPAAVASLAKILARDDPNRTFYKTIFAADSASSPPYDLLSRAFGLAIAPIPHYSRHQLTILEIRKGFVAHGLIAADILVTLVPATEHFLARSWLTSEDGFATSLLRLLSCCSVEQPHVQNKRVRHFDPEGDIMIMNLGTSILRNLAEKSKDSDPLSASLLAGIIPRKESLLWALQSDRMDQKVVRQLCALAGLES